MSAMEPASSTVDLRGFSYALSPYLAQQRWILDRIENQMAQAQKALTAVLAQFDEAQSALNNQAADLQQQLLQRPDPGGYQRGLLYLVDRQHHLQTLQQEIEVRRAKCKELSATRIAQQSKVDGLQEHREQALKDYAQESIRAASAEADRAWIGRHQYRQSQLPTHAQELWP